MDKSNVTSKYTRSVKWDISETLGPFKLQQNNQISQDSIVDGERARMVQIERVARPYGRRVREQAYEQAQLPPLPVGHAVLERLHQTSFF